VLHHEGNASRFLQPPRDRRRRHPARLRQRHRRRSPWGQQLLDHPELELVRIPTHRVLAPLAPVLTSTGTAGLCARMRRQLTLTQGGLVAGCMSRMWLCALLSSREGPCSGYALLTRRVRDGHQALGEAVAAITLGPERALPPEDESAQLALRVVVRRLDVIDLDEGPERLAVLPEVGARAAQALDVGVDPAAQRALEVRTHGRDARGELLAREATFFEVEPVGEEDLRGVEQLAPDGSHWSVALCERDEFPQQMGPADLP